MSDRETNAAPKIPTAELDRLATEAGMMSVLLDGAGSFVWSAGCNGVMAEHLGRFAELVAARALAAQAATAEPTSEQLRALREAHEIPASDGYFEARAEQDDRFCRKLFGDGFARGFDSGYAVRSEVAAHVADPGQGERVPMCEQEVLFTRPQVAGQAEDAARQKVKELEQEVARLQAALAFWMPDVPDSAHPLHRRAASDACLLVGFEGNSEDMPAHHQGLLSLAQPGLPAAVSRLIERWEERARKSFPTDAMLINKHVRELHEVLAAQQAGQAETGEPT